MAGWLTAERTNLTPPAFLRQAGEIFAVFDARGSGNVAFGVQADGRRWFVKTAGDPAAPPSLLAHDARVEHLLNGRRVAISSPHRAMPALRGMIPSAWGPMLVYDWAEGELLGGSAEQRNHPMGAVQRFCRLPADELTAALDTLFDAHLTLCDAGWIACDFYDSSILYDFAARTPWLIDLDAYRQGPFANDMGRMFGSTRFMAPEEFERGARIDQRTTVFNLGRAVAAFLSDGSLDRAAFRGTQRQYDILTTACRPDPAGRYQSVADLLRAWRG